MELPEHWPAKWHANVARAIGAERAKAWADAHELSSTDAAETRLDLHNNAVGQQGGRPGVMSRPVFLSARSTGRLCLYVGSC